MDPEKGTFVSVYFKNGILEQGIVESWSDNKSVLKSVSGNSLIIIQKTLEDVMLVKIEIKSKPIEFDDEIKLEEPEPNQNLRVMKLAELRRQKIIEDRRLAREQLTTFKASDNTGETAYGIPKLGAVSNSPPEKIR